MTKAKAKATATAEEVRRMIDLYAVRSAVDAVVINDCTTPERMREHLQNLGILYCDKLAEDGLDLFEADYLAQHFLAAALWCVTIDATLPEAILVDAIQRATLIAAGTGDARAAVQCAMHAGMTAAAKVLDGRELEAFTERLQQAVEAAATEPAGTA